jgi:splicing factor 3A subunit 2
MSAFEQRVEAPNKDWQYLLFACDPYETIGFKIPNIEIDKGEGRFFTQWDQVAKKFTLQLYFKEGGVKPPSSGPPPIARAPEPAAPPPPPPPMGGYGAPPPPPPPGYGAPQYGGGGGGYGAPPPPPPQGYQGYRY